MRWRRRRWSEVFTVATLGRKVASVSCRLPYQLGLCSLGRPGSRALLAGLAGCLVRGLAGAPWALPVAPPRILLLVGHLDEGVQALEHPLEPVRLHPQAGTLGQC